MFNDEIVAKILDRDEEVKDIDWATKMVSLISRNAKSIISKENYDLGKNILFGQFPDINFERIFVGDQMIKLKEKLTENNTLYFFERIRNAIIDERNQADLTISVNSLDPQKEEKKKYDKDLLYNRKGIEGLLNTVTSNNGMPPERITEENYHGNAQQFDEKGGNEFDSTELDAFFDRSWGLKDELAYQNALNYVFTDNEVVVDYDKKINDILICLHNFSQVYVDSVDGSIKIQHLYPYEPRVLHATGSNNYKDAQAWDVPKATNVRGFMRQFGTYFNFAEDWNLLLNASNGAATGYNRFTGITEGGRLNTTTGIKEGGDLIYGFSTGKTIDFDAFLDMPVTYLYSEWKTTNKTTKQKVVTPYGNIISRLVTKDNLAIDGYPIEEKYKECTYYAYSLEVTAISPKIIKWGKVYMQESEGFEDEYSGFTIKATKRDGVPIISVIKPFWSMINIIFKMLEMLVIDIKPDGLAINYSSMIKIAKHLKSSKDATDDVRTGIDMFLQMCQESSNIIYDNPTTPEGLPMGGGSVGVTVNKKGLNDSAIDITKIIDWAEMKATLYTGTQGLELADKEDGFKLTIERKKQTRAATSFIDFIMLHHLKDDAITVQNYVHDISKFPQIPAYKYLECAIGYKIMEYIASRKKAPHRYGTFIETFNNDIQLLEIRGRAGQSLEAKEISLEQYMVLMSIKNPVQAGMYLSYERKKADKKRQDEAKAALMGQDAINKKLNDYKIKLENVRGKWKAFAEDKRAAGFITASQQNSQATIVTKQIQEKGQNERLAANAINEIDKIAETATQNAQQPVNV